MSFLITFLSDLNMKFEEEIVYDTIPQHGDLQITNVHLKYNCNIRNFIKLFGQGKLSFTSTFNIDTLFLIKLDYYCL